MYGDSICDLSLQFREAGRLWRTLGIEIGKLRLLCKSVLDCLPLGFFTLLDHFLGACYVVPDIMFEGLEEYKAKDVIHTHNLPLPTSTSPSTSSRNPRNSNLCGVVASSNDLEEAVLKSLRTKPRRAGIILERKNATKKPRRLMKEPNCREMKLSSDETPCACWGWEVEESLEGQMFTHEEKLLDCRDSEALSRNTKMRWSECQCPECAQLLMPMSKARSRLHVQTWDLEVSDSRKIDPSEDFDDHPSTAKCTEQKSAGVFDARANQNSDTVIEDSNLESLRCLPASIKRVGKTGVIFLHGVFSSSDFWFDSGVIPLLDDSIKSRHSICVPDLLGCGRSPRPFDSVYTLNDQIDALENSVLKRYDLDSFHIVGHSMGTVVAVALAARFPSRLRSLTLTAPVYAGYIDAKEGGKRILTDCDSILAFKDPWSVIALRSLSASRHYNINRFFGHLCFSRHQILVPFFQRLVKNSWPASYVRDYLAVTHDAAWHIVHNTMIGGSHSTVPALQKLRDLGKRVFVVHGTRDKTCPYERSEVMAQHFDNVVLDAVPGRGHVSIVLGRGDELCHVLEREIRMGDDNFSPI